MSGAPIPFGLLPSTAQVDAGGRLRVGGVDLCSLAEEYGTPLFVYDEEHLRLRCREALAAWGPGVAYATKAFLCTAMARLAYEEGMALDVSTGGEMHVALFAGVPGGSLVMHGNNKSESELSDALNAGVGKIVVDSFDEIDRLESLAAGRTVPVMLRVTPGIEAHTHQYVRTGQADSKFGFGLESGQADEALARVRKSDALELVGVHTHIGSQIFSAEFFARLVEVVTPFVSGSGARELCVGGGLGVPYVGGEDAPTISEWAGVVRSAAEAAGLPRSLELTAEPGRSIVAQAGLTLYRIGTLKDVPGARTYISVDGGMSDNPRPVLYGSGYEAFLPLCAGEERRMVADVVGKHCESGDFIVRDACLPAGTAVGDILATPVSGAYGYSMASNYNKVPRSAVVFVSGGRSRLVVRRETYDDLVALDVPSVRVDRRDRPND